MQTLQTISTLAQAKTYLVTKCGIKPNWANAMVTEFYSYESAELLMRPYPDGDLNWEGRNVTVVHSEEQVFNMYKDWLSYGITEESDHITFDNQPAYTLEGDYLPDDHQLHYSNYKGE